MRDFSIYHFDLKITMLFPNILIFISS